MGSVIGDILPQAIGVAISPVPIIAVILMLFSKRARSNGHRTRNPTAHCPVLRSALSSSRSTPRHTTAPSRHRLAVGEDQHAYPRSRGALQPDQPAATEGFVIGVRRHDQRRFAVGRLKGDAAANQRTAQQATHIRGQQ